MNTLKHFRDTHIDSLAKNTYLIIENLIQGLNATRRNLIHSTWGYKDPKTGRLGGMLGDLIEGRAHMGGSVLLVMADRVHVIDYVAETLRTNGGFVFRAPPLSYTSNIYSLPLSADVWKCSIAMVILATVTIFVTYKYSKRSVAVSDSSVPTKQVSDFFLVGISAVCQMDPQIRSKYLSNRIAMVSGCDLHSQAQCIQVISKSTV